MRRRLTAVLLAATATLAVPAAADARIVLGREIAGVKLLDTVEEAKAVLGEPRSEKTQKDEIQGSIQLLDFGPTDIVAGKSGEVQAIETTSKRERLANGIGVGSTRKALRAKVRGVSCGGRVCTVGKLVAGGRVTTFRISRKARITAISVGIVID